MEKLIQMCQAAQEQASATAWLALGLLLPTFIAMGLIVFFWICRGGLARNLHELPAHQHQLARWLEGRDG